MPTEKIKQRWSAWEGLGRDIISPAAEVFLLWLAPKFNLSLEQFRTFFSPVLFSCRLYCEWFLPMPSLYCYRNKTMSMRHQLVFFLLLKIHRKVPTDFSRTSSGEESLWAAKYFYYFKGEEFEDVLAKQRLLAEDWISSTWITCWIQRSLAEICSLREND